jgi:hypothetical protein
VKTKVIIGVHRKGWQTATIRVVVLKN